MARTEEDLTNRLNALREVLKNQIESVQDAAEARSGLMSHAIELRIDAAMGMADMRAQLLQEELDRRLTTTLMRQEATTQGMQLQMDQRMENTKELVNMRCDEQGIALKAAFDAQQAAMRAAFLASEKAIDKAETASEKRFEGVNEFRAQLSDQAATFFTRNEFVTTHQALAEKLDVGLTTLAERLDQETRRAETSRTALELRLTSRLDLMTGTALGTDSAATNQRENINTKLIGLTVAISVVVILVNIIVAALTHHL